MAYKTCPDCGSRIYEYGCVNCNEEDYISMQGAYDTPEEKIPSQSIPTFITQSKIKLSAMDTYGNTKTKDISQYLHLYLGCEVEYMMEEDDIPKITRLDGKIIDEGKSCYWLKQSFAH